jgi:flagellar basal-body rod modification protein FlgD
MPEVNSATKSKYLDQDRSFNIQKHLDQLEKEEKSGLKGIEIREKAKELGKDDFLKILITQLSQQDPTNPMKDQEFIAQMAQFSSLEQMKNISTGISRMEAKQSYSVVGKIVSGPDLVTGEDVVGVAGAIFFDAEGKTYVRVNGRTIDIEKINLISDPNLLESAEQKNSSRPSSQPVRENPPVQDTPANESIVREEFPMPGYSSTDQSSSQKNKIKTYEDQVFIENDER